MSAHPDQPTPDGSPDGSPTGTPPRVPEDHDAWVDGHEQPLVAHLVELRQRLLKAVLGVLLAFFPLFFFANELYLFIAEPLLSNLPAGSQMIATDVASPFLTPFKLTLVLAVFLAIPWVLHQAWGFIAPGLYSHEKRFAVPLLASSVLLFYLGVAFAYFVVFPLVFQFMAGITTGGLEQVAWMTDIGRYLDFTLKLFFAFGLAFEIPIATLLMVATGISSVESLRNKRPYVVIGCFVLGMLLTPPDVISQVLLALPAWLLFEIGLLLGVLVERRRAAADADADG